MANISELPDDLLIKILWFLPTNFTVSTSVLSKRWKFLWMWSPNLHYIRDPKHSEPALRDFLNKNLPIHRAPVIESFHLDFNCLSIEPEDIKEWVRIAVSRCIRELHLDIFLPVMRNFCRSNYALLPSSMYTCKSLVSLKLRGHILMDIPPMGFLPSLKTLQLQFVKYSNEEALGLLLSYCPVLEDLNIQRYSNSHVRSLVVNVPSLLRLSLYTGRGYSSDGYVIVTPSLKYFKVIDYRDHLSYLIEDMPKLEEADIYVNEYIGAEDIEKLVKSITFVKRLSLSIRWNSSEVHVYRAGIVFNQLEHLTISIDDDDSWSNVVIRLLKDSPKLRVLNLRVNSSAQYRNYQSVSWNKVHTSVPECLFKSLESFKFEGYKRRPEERGFLNFLRPPSMVEIPI